MSVSIAKPLQSKRDKQEYDIVDLPGAIGPVTNIRPILLMQISSIDVNALVT